MPKPTEDPFEWMANHANLGMPVYPRRYQLSDKPQEEGGENAAIDAATSGGFSGSMHITGTLGQQYRGSPPLPSYGTVFPKITFSQPHAPGSSGTIEIEDLKKRMAEYGRILGYGSPAFNQGYKMGEKMLQNTEEKPVKKSWWKSIFSKGGRSEASDPERG